MKRMVLLLSLLAGPAMAEETGRKSFSELYPQMPGVEYYCRDATGTRHEIGQTICITASCLTWFARCDMAANNNLAMWRKLQDGCPTASLIDRLKSLG